MASAAIGLWVGVGGRHEPAALGGISHFIEHMVFKGTRRRTAAAISQAVEGIGGYLNAFTDEEHTCFYARAAAVHWPRLLDVLVDMLLHPRLDPADIDREREVILEEWSMYRDQPSELVHDLLNAAQFPRHPLGRPSSEPQQPFAASNDRTSSRTCGPTTRPGPSSSRPRATSATTTSFKPPHGLCVASARGRAWASIRGHDPHADPA